jgi:Flp pilus assembly pilin Flp
MEALSFYFDSAYDALTRHWRGELMRGLIRRLVSARRGAISVEYALAAGLLGVATALALAALGDALDQRYEPVTTVTAQGHDLSNERGF